MRLSIATSWLTFILERLPNVASGGANIKALRLLRLLKPLRALKAFPGLQMLISVCGALMHQLFTVYALALLLLVWWLAMLLPLWQGALTHRCVPVAALADTMANGYQQAVGIVGDGGNPPGPMV